MSFFQINKSIDVGPVVLGRENVRYGEEQHGVFRGLIYHAVDARTKKACLDIVPIKYRHFFTVVSHLTINHGEITPHIDSDTLVSINVYLQSEDFVTTFYTPLHPDTARQKIKNQSNGFCYELEHIKETGKFCARDGEIWVLDVSQIHSVTNAQYRDHRTRNILVIQTNQLSFDQVHKIFQQAGLTS